MVDMVEIVHMVEMVDMVQNVDSSSSPWRQSLSALFFCAGQSGFLMTLEENTVNVYKHPNIFFTLVIVETSC